MSVGRRGGGGEEEGIPSVEERPAAGLATSSSSKAGYPCSDGARLPPLEVVLPRGRGEHPVHPPLHVRGDVVLAGAVMRGGGDGGDGGTGAEGRGTVRGRGRAPRSREFKEVSSSNCIGAN